MPTKLCLVKAMVFPVVTCGCESWPIKKSWGPKNWTVVLEKTLESPLDCRENQPVHPKGNQSWVFNGRTDDESETPILWLPDAKNWLIGKDLDDGRDCGQEEKGVKEDEMVGWHHWLNGHEFGKLWELVMDREVWRAAVRGVTKCCTWQSNWNELKFLNLCCITYIYLEPQKALGHSYNHNEFIYHWNPNQRLMRKRWVVNALTLCRKTSALWP